jgi:hypothetical protein
LARVTGFNVFLHCGFHGSPIVGCRKSSDGFFDAKVSGGWGVMVVMEERNTKFPLWHANFVVSIEYSIMYVVGVLWFLVLFCKFGVLGIFDVEVFNMVGPYVEVRNIMDLCIQNFRWCCFLYVFVKELFVTRIDRWYFSLFPGKRIGNDIGFSGKVQNFEVKLDKPLKPSDLSWRESFLGGKVLQRCMICENIETLFVKI